MASRSVADRSELCALLSSISLDRIGGGRPEMLLAGRPLDVYRTHGANCKDSPALPLMVLPGFDHAALNMDADYAVANFKRFALSQFGQRRWFCFVYRDGALYSGFRRVRATVGVTLAAECSAHAAAQGQDDTYIPVRANDIVSVLRVDGVWALVKSFTLAVPGAGWCPSAYLDVRPVWVCAGQHWPLMWSCMPCAGINTVIRIPCGHITHIVAVLRANCFMCHATMRMMS